MGDFRKLSLKDSYLTDKDNTADDFWVPVISQSKYVFRGVGYFESSSFKKIINGLQPFYKNKDAKIDLLVGEFVNKDDLDVIKRGYDLKDKSSKYILDILEERLEIMIAEIDEESRAHIDLIAHLIATDKLDFKVAITNNKGIFHRKFGLFLDSNDQGIVTKGSDNQTGNAMSDSSDTFNIEEFDVFRSWDERDKHRYEDKKEEIGKMWKNQGLNHFQVIEFPNVLKNEHFIKRISDKDYVDPRKWKTPTDPPGIEPPINVKSPEIPKELNGEEFELMGHQIKAIDSWRKDDSKGMLKHATGSGKTISSICAATDIYTEKKKLALVIAVPYQELVDQWSDVLKIFNWSSLKCYKEQKKWNSKLASLVSAFNNNSVNNICVIVTNKTLTENVTFKKYINKINKEDLMFIGDECHHHSTETRKNSIPNTRFKLGLSATPLHYRDEEKKQITLDIYEKISHEFTLKDALDNDVLTPFRYEVVQVFLNEDENDTYRELSARLAAKYSGSSKGEKSSESLQALLAERSRLLTSSENKIPALVSTIQDNDPEPYTLFYVGDGRIDDDLISSEDNELGTKQINAITKKLSELNWGTSQFSYKETPGERKKILENFKNKMTDAIVAIRCLDEGVDIPDCQKAYLIASSRDERQYIQRAGRILRKSKDKDEATVIDFIMFPPKSDGDLERYKKNLIKNELNRARHFIEHSNNPNETIKLINDWLKDYNLDFESDELLQEDEY